MPKLVCMLRVKDGILFVGEWLERTSALVDEIVVVDNGSSDGTLEILQQHPSVVCVERTTGFDEGRDKILAYERVRSRNPDWVINLDVDEIFEQQTTRADLNRLMRSKIFTRYFFRLFHLIDYEHYNMRGKWFMATCWPCKVMWKEQATGYFVNLRFDNGMIRGVHGLPWVSHHRLRHLGYINKEHVRRKADIYRSLDPSREHTYVEMQHSNPLTWKWREFDEAPALVTAQNILMDVYLFFTYSRVVATRLQRRVQNRFFGHSQTNEQP
jgi:glycosyltransferase involved in cell wall biosynthesis